jgi:putative mRNA 3-end processing factor
MTLLTFTPQGIYCPQGDFYIDPWKKVDRAVITHAHADHAYPGHKHYLAQHYNKAILKLRLGHKINIDTVEYGESTFINGVKVSFHPAGHIIGSAQVRVEYQGEVWVASGDYKPEYDGLSTAFEPVKCNTFISESTFGLPIYQWENQDKVMQDVNEYWYNNSKNGVQTVLLGYSLGKSQRLLKFLDNSIGEIWLHDSIYKTQQTLIKSGHEFNDYKKVDLTLPAKKYAGGLIMAPPMVAGSAWLMKFQPYKLAMCSGWMHVKSTIAKRKVDAGFAMSDHADWNGLISSIKATEAENVYVNHGFSGILSHYLNDIGINSYDVSQILGVQKAEDEE